MPAMLEDPTRPAIHRTSGAPPYPSPNNNRIPDNITIRQVTLRDRITIASLIPFSNAHCVPPRLLKYLCSQMNLEIEKGDTYPMMLPMSVDEFGAYWFQNFGAIMLLGEIEGPEQVTCMEERGEPWERFCLGSFYVKPNYPGRSSHVCNGAFLVTEAARNRGVGRLMGEGYLEWAPKLGYTYSVFNLVYETNVASCRIWDALGFKRIGRIKDCGNLRSYPDELVDAIMFGRDLGPEGEEFVSEERFDKIRYYLKHGTYPSGADRAEKSRLRSAATHYKLLPNENGEGEKLMLKDKEVVSDPQRQYEISRDVHAQGHGGINKTTATIAEKHHWVRIKETVSLVIKNCPDCKESAAKAPTIRPTSQENGSAASQLRRAANNPVTHSTDSNSMIERLINFDPVEPSNQPSARKKRPSTSPPDRNNKAPQAPTANMRLMQHYTDIPLDPQIMSSHDTHPSQQFNDQAPHIQSKDYAHPASGTENPEPQYTDPITDLQDAPSAMKTQLEEHPDTRMATEQHVREGDQPLAYQDGEGAVHNNDVGMQDSVNEEQSHQQHDGDDAYLEELLRREA